jgi:hypothetical protein
MMSGGSEKRCVLPWRLVGPRGPVLPGVAIPGGTVKAVVIFCPIVYVELDYAAPSDRTRQLTLTHLGSKTDSTSPMTAKHP